MNKEKVLTDLIRIARWIAIYDEESPRVQESEPWVTAWGPYGDTRSMGRVMEDAIKWIDQIDEENIDKNQYNKGFEAGYIQGLMCASKITKSRADGLARAYKREYGDETKE